MKKMSWPIKLVACLASLILIPSFLTAAPPDQQQTARKPAATAADEKRWTAAYGSLPLAFEKNLGQTDPKVRFLSRGSGYSIFLTPQEMVLALRQKATDEKSRLGNIDLKSARKDGSAKESVIRIQMQGANPDPQVSGLEKLPGKTDYFTGNDPKNWRTDVPSYARVQYRDVYPGIDLVFYGNNRHFEYDYVVAPGAETKTIALNVSGERKLSIDHDGNLMMSLDNGSVEMLRPIAYQTENGKRREVAARYVVSSKDQIKFTVGSYDKTQPLVIDPVLNYSTYLGGSSASANGDVANAIAVDGSGNAYITGQTNSASFPTSSGAYSTALDPSGSVFVTELNPTGTSILYSSYLSGEAGEIGYGIAVDPAPSASCPNASSAPGLCIYVTGGTSSTMYPVTTTNAYSLVPLSAFISKINPALSGTSSLVYSSYIAGDSGDVGRAIAVDANSNAYVTGYTFSPAGAATLGDFTVVGGYQTMPPGSAGNAFLIRIDTTQSQGSSLIYSTYLGGTGTGACSSCLGVGDAGFGVAVNSSHIAYLTGPTSSPDFPTTSNAYLGQPFAAAANQAVFVSKIDTTQTGNSSLIYSSYLAGASPTGDIGNAIALGPGNVVYVTGQDFSAAFPVTESGSTTGQFPSPSDAATGVAFVSLIDTTQSGSSSLKYSVLLGGTGGDGGFGIKADSQGNAYIAGLASSADFPLTPGAFQNTRPNNFGDAFIAEIAPNGNGAADLLYSTYFGGSTGSSLSLPDRAYGLALDSSNNVYITGQTASSDVYTFSTGGTAFQTALGGANFEDGFVAKLTPIPTVTVSPTSLTFANQVVGVTSTPQTVTLTNNANVSLTISAPPSASTGYGTTANTCSAPVVPGGTCTVGVTFTPTTNPTQNGTLTFTDSNSLSDTSSPQTVTLNGTSIAAIQTVNPSPSLLTFSSQTVNTTSTAQTVTITNTGNAPITMSTPSISVSVNYGQTNTCDGATLQPPPSATSCTISVTFTPTTGGTLTGQLSIADNATGSPQQVNLTGTGTALTQTVSVSPSPLTFSSQNVGTMSAAQVVTVSNTGTGPVTMSTPSISLPAGDFTQTNTCDGAVLQPAPSATTCTISVKFVPTAGGTRTSVVSIADNATGSPQQLNLSGTGVALTQTLSLSPSPLTFASQKVGTMSAAQVVTVSNTGTGPVTMSTPSISLPAGDFTQTNTCDGAVLQPAPSATTCAISVKFVPTAGGTRTAVLSVADNATGSPQQVNLSGTGVALTQTVSLSPSPLTFASQNVGTVSAAQIVTVSNTGTGPVTMSTPSISLPAGDFTQTNNCDGTVLQPAPSATTCTISVKFAPAAAGARTGVLSVADNATGSPQTVNLTGTGVALTVAVSITPTTGLSFTNQTINTTSAVQTVTVTNTGTGSVVFGASPATIAAPFAITTNSCASATLQPLGTCTINVTFTPTASTTPQTGTLTIADNAPNSPQSVSLTGTVSTSGTDFGFNLPSTSFTATPGVPLSFTINLVSTGGFNTPVTFTCTTNIPQGSCQAPASPVTPTAAPGTAASFIILTKAAFLTPTSSVRTPPISKQQILLLAMAALMLFLIPATRKLRLRLGLAGAMVLFALLAGCSNTPPNSSTPAGSYTVTITGTAGTVTHSSTINVAVN